MKQNWELDELIENWTLLPQELSWLSNKSRANLLTTALLLKWFQYETKFPNSTREIPDSVIDYLARQLDVSVELITEYDWQGRSYKRHCAEVRQFLGIRKAKVKDAQDLITWLIANVLDKEVDLEHLKEIANQRFWSLKIQPPPPNRVERLVRSALRTYETNFFQQTLDKLSPQCRTQIDALLITSEPEETDNTKEKTTFKASKFHFLNSEPGRASLNSLLTEIAKLPTLRQIRLPKNLFRAVSPKVLQAYSTRAGIEYPSHLRSHPEPTRYTLMATFCHLRTLDVTDNLVDLLIQMIHGIGKRAEKKVNTQLMRDFKKVRGKHGILFQMANASLEQPEGKIQEVIYPVVSQQTLQDLVKELKASGTAYRQKIHTVVRSSYRHHYRRILPKLLSLLEFRSNNDIHQPVIEALKLLKKYANSKQRYLEVEVPKAQKKLPNIPTEEEIKRYYDAVWQARNVQDMVIIKTLLYTGVRVSELVNIKIEDVDFQRCQIRISDGKGGKDRIVPFPISFKEVLAMHVDQMSSKNATYLFESSWKRKYSTRGIHKILAKYAEAAGLSKPISPHQLRHFLLTWLKKQGIDDALIQPYSGHSSRQSLEVYSRLSIGEAQEIYEQVMLKFPV